jgi:thiamine biosynthesis lipoprotein
VEPKVYRRARPLLGTLVDVQAEGPDAEIAVAAALDEVDAVQALLSFHANDSELQTINRAAPGVRLLVDSHTLVVLRLAAALYVASAGAFDCRLGAPDMLANVRFPVVFDDEFIVKETRASMDLGGIAKGYAVDCAIEVIRSFNIERAIVNAGGDLRHYGVRPMSVQVRNPRNAAQVAASVPLDNAGLASSTAGGLDAHADSTSRIYDANRRSLPALAGATVLAPTCMLADALTKVVLATGDATHPLLTRYGAAVTLYSPA